MGKVLRGGVAESVKERVIAGQADRNTRAFLLVPSYEDPPQTMRPYGLGGMVVAAKSPRMLIEDRGGLQAH